MEVILIKREVKQGEKLIKCEHGDVKTCEACSAVLEKFAKSALRVRNDNGDLTDDAYLLSSVFFSGNIMDNYNVEELN